MSEKEDMADSYFHCTEGERAAFEAGIKLATVYHQFVGTPFNSASLESLERGIEEAIAVQPYVEDVTVRIDPGSTSNGEDVFAYSSLTGEMISVELTILAKGVRLKAVMRRIAELNYPLMYIEGIERSE